MDSENKKVELRRLLITIGIVLFTAIVFGGGTYYVLNENFKAERAANDSKVENLQSQVEKKQVQKPTEESSTNIFDVLKVKAGDKIAGMTVLSVKPYSTQFDLKTLSEDNVNVQFSGKASLVGSYNYVAPDSNTLGGGNYIVFTVSKDSLKNFPISKDQDSYQFVLLNTQEAKKLLNLGSSDSSGNASITIDQYSYIRYPSSVTSTARLLSVQ